MSRLTWQAWQPAQSALPQVGHFFEVLGFDSRLHIDSAFCCMMFLVLFYLKIVLEITSTEDDQLSRKVSGSSCGFIDTPGSLPPTSGHSGLET